MMLDVWRLRGRCLDLLLLLLRLCLLDLVDRLGFADGKRSEAFFRDYLWGFE